MAKKQTRRSISVSRTTYERLKAFCETNNISMSQLVETRVNDFLGTSDVAPMPSPPLRPVAPRPVMAPPAKPVEARPVQPSPSTGTGMATGTTSGTATGFASGTATGFASGTATGFAASSASASAVIPPQPVPMTSAAARFVVEPPPPIIKPRQDTAAPKPAEKRPEQIFTF